MRKFYLYYGIVGLLVEPCVVLNRGSRVWPERPCLAMRTKAKSSGIFRLCHLVCYSHEPHSLVYSKQKEKAAVWFLNKACVMIPWFPMFIQPFHRQKEKESTQKRTSHNSPHTPPFLSHSLWGGIAFMCVLFLSSHERSPSSVKATLSDKLILSICDEAFF